MAEAAAAEAAAAVALLAALVADVEAEEAEEVADVAEPEALAALAAAAYALASESAIIVSVDVELLSSPSPAAFQIKALLAEGSGKIRLAVEFEAMSRVTARNRTSRFC